MNESLDRALADWLHEGPENGPRDGLERALAMTRRAGQRPGWTLPGKWIPMELTMARTRVQRPILAIVMLALLTVAVVAAALFVGAEQQQPPLLFRNGVIALAKDGDIFVADRPGGDLRPPVAGPEDDRSPMFSPDGTRLAFFRDTGQETFLMVADADGTNVVEIPLEATDDWSGLWSFAPDGRSLMTVANIDGTMRVVVRPVDPAAAPIVLDIQLLDASMYRSWAIPTFNPTNAQEILVVARLEPDAPEGGGLYVYDLATGGIRTIVEPADEQYFQDIAWLADGEHIIYNRGLNPHIVAADGSGDQAFDALRGRFSPLSNDGTRIVAERDGEGVQTGRPVIVPINGVGEPVVLACGPGTDIECPEPPTDWIWSPDDSLLIGTVYHETSSSGEGPLTETYLLVDAHTGQVTKLDWVDVGTPAWQRVAP